jgi:RING-finger-containing ubiquitin ligase
MLTMYLMLILGYIYAVFYVMFLCLIGYIYWRRMSNNRARRSETTRIMRSISRVRFSEDLFGAISDDNECIICMTAFGPDDMITKLDCPGNHFYHTACIENWIAQGSTQCPMCRHDISGLIPGGNANQSEL